MDLKQRTKTLRGGFRKEAQKVRSAAIGNLRQSLKSNSDLEKGVRIVVYKRVAGFKVTIAPKYKRKGHPNDRQYGFHKNRQGLEKPILVWAEKGTASRRTKTATKVSVRKRSSHWTGSMRMYGFMKKTGREVESGVATDLHEELKNSIIKNAEKYGCK